MLELDVTLIFRDFYVNFISHNKQSADSIKWHNFHSAKKKFKLLR